MIKKDVLLEIKCKVCKKYFLYCIKSGRDTRCYRCKSGTTVDEVQKELEEMSKEEYDSFMKDIEDYKKNNKKT